MLIADRENLEFHTGAVPSACEFRWAFDTRRAPSTRRFGALEPVGLAWPDQILVTGALTYLERRFTAYPYWTGQAGCSSRACCALMAQ